MNERPPETVGGRYRVLGHLGKGAMGVVFMAHDPVLDRKVAIKQMTAEIARNEELRQRFYVEARAAARLNHPNIITIHELQEAGGEVYMVMELLDGKSLASLAAARPVPLSLEATLDVMAQACDGLDYAHRHSIVHRDIKPANLFLTPSGTLKILDFGIARFGSLHMTAAGSLIGTPDYMAPEQVRGDEIDRRTDLWAVGAVLYQLLSGTKPFEGKPLARLLAAITQVPHVSLSERAPSVPRAVSDLVDRLLSKARDQRPATAGIVRDELRAILGRESTPATRASLAGEDFGQTLLVVPEPVVMRPPSGSMAETKTASEEAGPAEATLVTPPPLAAPVAPPLPPAAPAAASPLGPPPAPPPVAQAAPTPPAPASPAPPPPTPSMRPDLQAAEAAARVVAPPVAAVRRTGGGAGRLAAFAVLALLALGAVGVGSWWYLKGGGAATPSDEPAVAAAAPVAVASGHPPADAGSPSVPTLPQEQAALPAAPRADVSSPAADPGAPAPGAVSDRSRPAESLAASAAVPSPAVQEPARAVQPSIPSRREEPGARAAETPSRPPAVAPLTTPPDGAGEQSPRGQAPPRAQLTDDTVEALAGRRSGQADYTQSPGNIAAIARVRHVIEQYRLALERGDAGLLQRYRPDVSAAESRWLQARELKVTLEVGSVDVDGATATATCRRQLAGLSAVGASIREQGSIVIQLQRQPSGWVITSIR